VNRTTILCRQWPLAISWAALAVLSVSFTRFEGGVAFLWGSTALLIVALIRTSRKHWWAPLATCAAFSFVITGTIGLGWIAAVPFAAINLGEAVIAATLMRKRPDSGELMASLSWFGRFMIATTTAPVLMAPVAAVVLWTIGGDPAATLVDFVSGHALGNMTLVPIAYILTGKAARQETRRLLIRKWRDALIVFPIVICVTVLVFWQTTWPLLFLPVMVVVLATFRLGRTGAAVSLALLLIIGGYMTAQGLGPIRLSATPIKDRLIFFQYYLACTVLTVLPIAADLNARRKLHRQVKRSEGEFRMLAEHCTDVIMRVSPVGLITYVSPSVSRLTGYSPAALVGRPSRTIIDPRDLDKVIGQHRATLAARGEPRSYDYRAITIDGATRWFSTHARALLDEDGEPFELLAIIRDISDVKANEQQWAEAALTDTLTGLPNRRALQQQVASLPGSNHCLALLDLDRFKEVNDTFGHACGDAVLQGVAEILARSVRSHDWVARLGGEEFVILFEQTSLEQAYQVCERMRRELAGSAIETPAGPLRVTLSGGVAPIDRDGLEASLKAADEALYRAKRGGRDRLLLAA
jgi:diguanylate cyclase (GGDEF)-like protein/PAS domain S-box-containing protein